MTESLDNILSGSGEAVTEQNTNVEENVAQAAEGEGQQQVLPADQLGDAGAGEGTDEAGHCEGNGARPFDGAAAPVTCKVGLLAMELARLIRGSVARSIEKAGLTLGLRATKFTASHSCRR